jgi:hypothetical protein
MPLEHEGETAEEFMQRLADRGRRYLEGLTPAERKALWARAMDPERIKEERGGLDYVTIHVELLPGDVARERARNNSESSGPGTQDSAPK